MKIDLNKFKEELAKKAFKGMSPQQAWEKDICIKCKQPAIPNCYSFEGLKEYRISALCEKCFDNMFEEED